MNIYIKGTRVITALSLRQQKLTLHCTEQDAHSVLIQRRSLKRLTVLVKWLMWVLARISADSNFPSILKFY